MEHFGAARGREIRYPVTEQAPVCESRCLLLRLMIVLISCCFQNSEGNNDSGFALTALTQSQQGPANALPATLQLFIADAVGR